MPAGNVKVEEFRESVREEYGPEIAKEFVQELGASASSISYSRAIKVLDTVLSRYATPSHSGPTTSRVDISWVI
jgi:hypothetical protein